ncbi:MAG: hypothetical protein M3Y13_02320, partial [Armatimonadota bacterium]|nr:hypothetical protein [Armatimonadota bacterium]
MTLVIERRPERRPAGLAEPPKQTDPLREPCADMARRLRAQAAPIEMSRDALDFLIESYAKLVEGILDPRASPSGIEFAYSRLLGTRGGICR